MSGTCSFDGCDNSIKCKELCSGHHSQFLRGQTLSILGKGIKYWNEVDLNTPSGYKVCRSCLETKLLTEFSNTKPSRSKDGRHAYCLVCSRFKEKLWKYGITKDEYVSLYEFQNGCCAICNLELPFMTRDTHLDHCHSTNKIRGILCRSCNVGLGNFGDNPELLESAALYLRKRGD